MAFPLTVTIEHLRWLCRSVGPDTNVLMAPAVYSQISQSGEMEYVVAAETGYEGVACVDDAARLALLLDIVGKAAPRLVQQFDLTSWRQALLQFVRRMWVPDVGFNNFVLDWDGAVNALGPTSYAGGRWWAARAARALASERSSSEPTLPELQRVIHRLVATSESPEEESALVWSLVDLTGMKAKAMSSVAVEWAASLCEQSAEHTLPATIVPTGAIQLWGRSQELVLALVGHEIDERQWISLARTSCHESLRPLVDSSFQSYESLAPYEVSSVVRNLAVVGVLAGDAELIDTACLGFDWFLGRNASSLPIVDPTDGRTADGLDGATVSRNSGAEANIEACSAWCALRWTPGQVVP